MKTTVLSLLVICLFMMTCLSSTYTDNNEASEGFRLPCQRLPFDPIKKLRQIDRNCDMDGSARSAAGQLQNTAKNNFCASGRPLLLQHSAFIALQRAVDAIPNFTYGNDNLPTDRTILNNINIGGRAQLGEGRLVSYVGFVISARFSNVSNGESVNCTTPGEASNDIHIEMGIDPNDDPCHAVTAEISPHFRPEAWEEMVNFDHTPRPVKITGPLFFDASHHPCVVDNRGGIHRRSSPARISSWEIHPVYAIDVCKNKTLQGCNPNDPTKWVPFHEWIGADEHDDNQ